MCNRKWILRWAIVAISLAFSLFLLGYYISPQVWRQISQAQLWRNGLLISKAHIYRSPSGKLLIDSGDPSDYLYVVRPNQNAVGITSSGSFWVMTPLLAITKDYEDPSINLNSVKFDFRDPKLVVNKQSATFTDLKGRQIYIQW